MKKSVLKLTLCGVFLVLYMIGAQAQGIYPNASGYGTDSRGAYQLYKETGNLSDLPKVLYVSSLDGSNSSSSANSGTLSWCLSQNYPRIILFNVGGVIDWSVLGGDYNWLQVKSPYCNIYGQSAPSPGITIIGGKLHFQGTHDILVQHLKIRPIDNEFTWGKEIDCIGGWAGNHHIVIDHCSFSWSIDELIGFNTANDITFSNCIFSEPLDHNTHPSEGDQYHAMLATLCYVQRFSSIGNLYAHGRLRAPFFNGGIQDIYISNNLIYNVRYGGIYLRDEWNTEALTKMDIVNNYYKPGLNTSSGANYMVYIRGDVNPGAEFYINGNHSPFTTDQLSAKMVSNEAGIKLQTTTPLTDPKGHVPVQAKDVPQYIYKNAGAFHWDRDMTDKRIIQGVIDSNGVIIDSTSQLNNLYIDLKKVTHVLTLPKEPNEDENGDGHTNIEEWLYRLGSSDVTTRNSILSNPDYIPTKPTLPVEDIDTGNVKRIEESSTGYCGFTDEMGSIDTNHIGFTGDGFANSTNEMGVELNWAVRFYKTGKYRFSWKTSATNIRPANLIINGNVIKNISFGATPDFDTWIVVSTDVDVNEGGAKIMLKSTSASGLPNIDNLKVVALETTSLAMAADCETVLDPTAGPVADNEITIQENEIGFCGFYEGKGTLDTNHIGYTGDGFANTTNETGVELCWALHFLTAGTYRFSWKFSGTNIRPANLIINGNIIKNISFSATPDFDTWTVISTDVFVSPGSTNILLKATSGSGLPNIDNFSALALETQAPVIIVAECQADKFLYKGTSLIQAEIPVNPGIGLPDTELTDKQEIPTLVNSNNAIKGMSLFPNPGGGKFFIKISDLYIDEYIVKVTIINLSGQVIYKKELNANDNTADMEFDISNNKKGIYLFNLQTSQNRKISRKVIVN